MDADQLERAPAAVQRAARVLAENQEKRVERTLLRFLPLLLMFLGFPAAGILATATGSEAIGALFTFR